MQFYISGALEDSAKPSSARELLESCGRIIKAAGGVPYLTPPETGPEETEDYPHELAAFYEEPEGKKDSKASVIFLNEPSLKVGFDIATSLYSYMPILALIHRNRDVPKYVKGLFEEHRIELQHYEGECDLEQCISHFVADCLAGNEPNGGGLRVMTEDDLKKRAELDKKRMRIAGYVW